MLVQDKLISLTLTQAQSSAHSGGMVLDNAALTGMLAESTLTLKGMLIIAVTELCIITVALWLHAVILSRKNPRKLLGK